MRKLSVSFMCCLLLWAMSGCYVKKSWQSLRADSFNSWVSKMAARAPLNEKERAVLQAQYAFFLNRAHQLQLQAEAELNRSAAGKIASFQAISNRVTSLSPALANEHFRYPWYADLYKLAPTFPFYVDARLALKIKSYDLAFQMLARCPEDHPAVKKQLEQSVKTMLKDYADRFEKAKTAQRFDELAQQLNGLNAILEAHQLSVEHIPYHNGDYPTYGILISSMQIAAQDSLISSAKLLAASKSYVQAIALLDQALPVADKVNKEKIASLQTDMRKVGIGWHDQIKQQAVKTQKYDVALAQLDTVCLLDKPKDCTTERNRLLTAQLLQNARISYDTGNKKAAADMLRPLPNYAAGNKEAIDVAERYCNEYGLDLIKEADRECKDDNHNTAISIYRKAKKYLTRPEDAQKGIADCDDFHGMKIMREAARLAADGKYKEAAERVKEAMKYVKDKAEAKRLYEHYKEKAMKRVAIVLQAQGSGFNIGLEKYALVDAVAKNIKEDEYTQVVYSQDLPVIGLNENPAVIAQQVGANFVLSVALDNPAPEKRVDHNGLLYQSKYCTSTSRSEWNGYQWIKVLTYSPTPVRVFTDNLNVSVKIRAYLVEVRTGDQLNNYDKYVSRSWSNDYWYAEKEGNYIRECPCNGLWVTTLETSFVGAEKFAKTRGFPAVFGLIKGDLYAALRTIGSDASQDLARH